MKYAFQGTLLALVALGITGCGGCGKRKERPSLNRAEYTDEEAGAAAAPAPAAVVEKPKTVVLAGTADPEDEPAPAVKAAPPKPKRPEDLAAWQPDDFRSAVQDKDQRAAQAILMLARDKVGDEETAQLLLELITAKDKPVAAPVIRSTSGDDDEWTVPQNVGGTGQPTAVGPAVVAGLAINGSPPAEAALKSILRGQFKTAEDDRTLVQAAIAALVQNLRPSYERMLLAALTLPEQVRPAGQGKVTAMDLQALCAQGVEPVASPALRRQIAEHLLADGTPESHALVLQPMLERTQVANLEAQVLLLGQASRGNSERQLRESIKQFASESIDRLLDVPLSDMQRRRGEGELRPDTLPIAAKALWDPALAECLARSLDQPDEASGGVLEDVGMLALLPVPAARSSVFSLLDRNHVVLADKFNTDQRFPKEWRDPGLLLVLKALPREQSPEARGGNSKREGSAKKNSKGMTGAKAAAMERARKEREARYAWLNASEKFIWTLNERLLAAANQQAARAQRPARAAGASHSGSGEDPFDRVKPSAGKPAASGSAGSEGSADTAEVLPIKLPEGIEPRATYALDWPEGLRGQLAPVEVAPMKVRYARIETSDRMTRVFNFFHRQLKSPDEYAIKRGRWLDSVTRDAETGLARSIDVLIYRTIDEAPASRDTVEDLVIEILMVEVPDPAAKAQQTARTNP